MSDSAAKTVNSNAQTAASTQPLQAMPGSFNSAFLMARIKDICLNPKTSWSRIKSEPADIRSMYTGFILFLAAIPPVAEFLRMITIGRSIPFIGTFRWHFFGGLFYTLVQYAAALGTVYLAALAIEKISQRLGTAVSRLDGLKLLAYSAAPAWAAGVFFLIPGLDMVLMFVAGVFSLYLFYQGISGMTAVPNEKKNRFFGLSLLAAAVIGAILNVFVAGWIQPVAPEIQLRRELLDIPAGITVDLEKFEKSMEELQKKLPKAD